MYTYACHTSNLNTSKDMDGQIQLWLHTSQNVEFFVIEGSAGFIFSLLLFSQHSFWTWHGPTNTTVTIYDIINTSNLKLFVVWFHGLQIIGQFRTNWFHGLQSVTFVTGWNICDDFSYLWFSFRIGMLNKYSTVQ